MGTTFSYKKKTHLLIGVAVLTLFLSFFIAVRPTIVKWEHVRSLEMKLVSLEKAPAELKQLEKRTKELERRIGKDFSIDPDVEKSLLQATTSYCSHNNLLIREFPEVHHVNIQGYMLCTYQVIIEGSFIPMLELLHQMEMEFHQARVVSAIFQSKMDLKQKKIRLTLSVFFQTINSEGNEK